MFDIWKSKEYQKRVLELEEEGCTTSDAQGIADAEFGSTESDIKYLLTLKNIYLKKLATFCKQLEER